MNTNNTIKNKATFLKRVGELLNEGYTFSQAVFLVLPHHTPHYESVYKEIEKIFHRGLGPYAVLKKLKFPEAILLSIIIAEKNGRLKNVLNSLSIQMARTEESKKKFKSLLMYPITLLIFVGVLLFMFRQTFLPNMQALSRVRDTNPSFIIENLPKIVSYLPDVIFTSFCMVGLITFALFKHYKRISVKKKMQLIKKLPIIRRFIVEIKTEQFSRELGSLLEVGIPIQQSLKILSTQQADPLLGEISATIKELIKYGSPIHEAIAVTDGLTKELSTFVKHGEDSGHLAKELLIYSKHLEETIQRKLAKMFSLLQPLLFTLIAICILAAYVALLLPIYSMLETF